MAKRYTYSKTIKINGSDETFSAVEFDSFDEAIRAVEKGVNDRRLQVAEEANKSNGALIQGLGKKEEPENKPENKPEEVDDVETFDTTNPLPGDDEDED